MFYDAAEAGELSVTDAEWGLYMRGNRAWGHYSLFRGSHDAVGFYATLAQHGVDIWHRLLPLADTSGGPAAMAFVMQGTPPTTLSSMASQAMRTNLNAAWSLQGQGLSRSVKRPSARTDPLRPDAPAPLRLEVGASEQRALTVPFDPSADVVEVEAQGFGRMVFDRQFEEHWEAPLRTTWCLRRDGCVCPNGSLAVRGRIEPRPSGVSLTVTLDGSPLTESSLSLRARRMNDLCGDAGAPPGDGDVDPCLVGRWRMDNASARTAW